MAQIRCACSHSGSLIGYSGVGERLRSMLRIDAQVEACSRSLESFLGADAAFSGIDKTAFVIGSPGRTRTADPVINSHLLYQLSYRGTSVNSTGSHTSPSKEDLLIE